jgi:hypothetical protein
MQLEREFKRELQAADGGAYFTNCLQKEKGRNSFAPPRNLRDRAPSARLAPFAQPGVTLQELPVGSLVVALALDHAMVCLGRLGVLPLGEAEPAQREEGRR